MLKKSSKHLTICKVKTIRIIYTIKYEGSYELGQLANAHIMRRNHYGSREN